jgi:hypothetical protein
MGAYAFAIEQALARLHWYRAGLRIRREVHDDIRETVLGRVCSIGCWTGLRNPLTSLLDLFARPLAFGLSRRSA